MGCPIAQKMRSASICGKFSSIHPTALGHQGKPEPSHGHEAEISGLLNSLKERYAVLVALVAGTGLRIGEALAVRTEGFDPDCQVLHIRRSVWHRCEQAPKTPNAIRLVDIPEALAQVLRRYTEGKEWLPLHDEGRAAS